MRKFLKRHKWSIILWGFLISSYILFSQVLMTGYVTSESMLPTLKVGNFILSLRIFDADSLKVGDIIVFKHKTQNGKEEIFIKRIAAVSGDTITVDETEVTLQDGEFYVLGDNSDNSWDSRYWNEPLIHAEDIKGKVIYYETRHEKIE